MPDKMSDKKIKDKNAASMLEKPDAAILFVPIFLYQINETI